MPAASGSLVLVRNPSWEPQRDRLRPAYPDRIEMSIGGGDHELFAERVDAAEIRSRLRGQRLAARASREVSGDPALEDRLYVHARDLGWALTMNLAMPPFDDVHVRRAVNRAIDEAALVDLLSELPYGPAGNGAGFPGGHIAPDLIEGLLLRSFDPHPYDPAGAREEMRASAYDRTGDGVCDALVCREIRALVPEFAVLPLQAEAVRADLAEIGIELELETRPWPAPFFSLIHDPRKQIPIVIAYPWFMDYPEGTGWYTGLFDGPGRSNTLLVGAGPEQLRKWGYEVRSVPSIDGRLEACQQRRGIARTQCWAELDQYLMTEVVPRVPYMFLDYAQAVSERLVAYSFDAAFVCRQSTGSRSRRGRTNPPGYHHSHERAERTPRGPREAHRRREGVPLTSTASARRRPTSSDRRPTPPSGTIPSGPAR